MLLNSNLKIFSACGSVGFFSETHEALNHVVRVV